MTRARGVRPAVLVSALAGAPVLALLSFFATDVAFMTGCDENRPSASTGVCNWLDEGGFWQLPLLAALIWGGGAILAARLGSARVAWLAMGLALAVGALLPLALTR